MNEKVNIIKNKGGLIVHNLTTNTPRTVSKISFRIENDGRLAKIFTFNNRLHNVWIENVTIQDGASGTPEQLTPQNWDDLTDGLTESKGDGGGGSGGDVDLQVVLDNGHEAEGIIKLFTSQGAQYTQMSTNGFHAIHVNYETYNGKFIASADGYGSTGMLKNDAVTVKNESDDAETGFYLDGIIKSLNNTIYSPILGFLSKGLYPVIDTDSNQADFTATEKSVVREKLGFDTQRTVTTLTGLPNDRELVFASFTVNQTLTETFERAALVIAKNIHATADVTITLPTSANYVNYNDTTITLPAGKTVEINIMPYRDQNDTLTKGIRWGVQP